LGLWAGLLLHNSASLTPKSDAIQRRLSPGSLRSATLAMSTATVGLHQTFLALGVGYQRCVA
jgi:hypothetical protein